MTAVLKGKSPAEAAKQVEARDQQAARTEQLITCAPGAAPSVPGAPAHRTICDS